MKNIITSQVPCHASWGAYCGIYPDGVHRCRMIYIGELKPHPHTCSCDEAAADSDAEVSV